MFKSMARASVLFAGIAMAACSGSSDNSKLTGSVDLDLNIPDGQSVDTINLNLSCPGSDVNQNHVLNVVNGEVVAAFGGLAPGACSVTLATQTANGTDCNGSANFAIVAGQRTDVEVTLTCQGVNVSDDGSAKVSTRFDLRACADDRIKKIYAIPANLLLGESTQVEVEVNTDKVQGTATYSWSVRNDATHTGQGTLAAVATCNPASASCQSFTCTGLGPNPGTDARTGLPSAGVFVSVKFEDTDCFDTEEVWVDCIQASVCGDGNQEGVEECDDSNTASEDGCSATCKVERCGDSIVQAGLGEECDGSAPEGFGCTAECKLSANPVCGDGAVNQASEQCDGTAGLLAGQQCSATCQIVPVCGNGIVEGTEQCDENSASCVNCETVSVDVCGQCIATLPDIGEFNANVCQPNTECKAALTCLLANTSCWTTIAPAACYCGNTQADIDACENPTFEPKGDCAAELKAGAGTNPTNAEVLGRYFDFDYASGHATIITDAAFLGCNAQCF